MQTTNDTTPDLNDPKQRQRVRRAIDKKSYAVISTVSEAGFPHAAGVVYDSVDSVLYLHTMRTSRKARNVMANPRVGVVIPVRRLPVGPPFALQFQATAEVLDMDDPEIVALVRAGQLKKTSGHGALDEPDGCFIRITPKTTIHSYGIGVSTVGVIRDPLHVGARSVKIDRP